jgi:thiol-disulfide isomerase/thioredoxin
VILGLFLIVLTLAFLVYQRLSPQGWFSDLSNDLKSIDPGESAQYTDLDGNPLDLKDFKGKPLVINAWATWSPFSQNELALFGRLKEEYGDQINILAVNRMEQIPVIRAYIGEFGVSDGIVLIADPSDNFFKAIGGYAMPETVFYDKDGTIVFHKRGSLSEDEIVQYTEAIAGTE